MTYISDRYGPADELELLAMIDYAEGSVAEEIEMALEDRDDFSAEALVELLIGDGSESSRVVRRLRSDVRELRAMRRAYLRNKA